MSFAVEYRETFGKHLRFSSKWQAASGRLISQSLIVENEIQVTKGMPVLPDGLNMGQSSPLPEYDFLKWPFARVLTFVSIGACFAAMVVSGIAASMELRSLASAPANSTEQFYEIASGGETIGLSSYTKKYVLNGCMYGMTSLQSQVRSNQDVAAFAHQCALLAGRIVASMPTNAYGWLVLAQAGAKTGNVDFLNRGLEQSFLTGRNEQWLAELRVGISEGNRQNLKATVIRNNDTDLTLLASNWAGIQSIASQYAGNPGFRDRAVNIVTKMPAHLQRRFLDLVKNNSNDYVPDHAPSE
jgi:hypothetical protein